MQYIIKGKAYNPGKSVLLCEVLRDGGYMSLFPQTIDKLYRTAGGEFFKVHYGRTKTTVTVLTEAEALEFMDNHAAYIKAEAYTQTFGEPKEA